ncbi:MAG TPA: hypothetical protein VFV97_00095 [Rhodanobacteraceae bacterium]|nr:hypothetical protein [Rhodanobacteraceae bacterium]
MRTRTLLQATLVAAVLGVAANPAAAKENYHETTFNADTPEKFKAVADDVRKEMEPGGRYEQVKARERVTIEQALTDMEGLMQATGGVEHMKQDDKVKLFNDQEVVNAILTKRDNDRVICDNAPKLGSHVRSTGCHTYGQEEDARRGSKDQMDEWTRRGCAVAGCVGSSPPRPTTQSGGGP